MKKILLSVAALSLMLGCIAVANASIVINNNNINTNINTNKVTVSKKHIGHTKNKRAPRLDGTCVNNLMCAPGMMPACINGKPTCIDAVPLGANGAVNPAPAVAAMQAISIQNFSFAPATITVKKGTTVTWTNRDGAPHTITGDSGGPASPTLAQGQSYSYVFSTPGTYPYHCSIHPGMRGTVTVQ